MSLPNSSQMDVINAWTNTSDNIFCTGHGGTGKSWLLQYIRNLIVNDNENDNTVVVTAPTGTAAFNVKGITLHKFAGVGIETNNRDKMLNSAKYKAKKHWINTDILIIDEISMISATFFSNLSYIAQQIRQSKEPFGGIRLLIFGDFLQLPPISKTSEYIPRVFESRTWKRCISQTFMLKEDIRHENRELSILLNHLRMGHATEDVCNSIKLLSRNIQYDDNIQPVKLFARKSTVDTHNSIELDKIDAPIYSFIATDKGDKSALNSCPAQSILTLKKGAHVMLIRNISSSLVNGSIGIITDFIKNLKSYIPVVTMIDRYGTKTEAVIDQVTWEVIEPFNKQVASRKQFPLILSWAITIHKSQSKTIPRLFVDCDGIFESGQCYVALSRCRSLDNLQVVNFDPKHIIADSKSIEYYNILDSTTDVELVNKDKTIWAQDTVDNQIMMGTLSLNDIDKN